jgi:hypothetical protein
LVTSFGSYFAALQIEQEGLDISNGFDLEIIPLDLPDGTNHYNEAEIVEKIRSGEWDCVLTTLASQGRYGNYGKVTAVIDESAGADQFWVKEGIKTINDLKGKRIAYLEGSVSEFMMLVLLNLVGLGPADVVLIPKTTTSDAVAAFNRGEADAISAWEPDVLEAQKGGGHLLVGSDVVRYIVDVIIVSNQAIETKPQVVQAFHRAWFQALKEQYENLPAAADSIAAWGHNDWTYVFPGTAESDMRSWLKSIAQAGLGPNLFIMQNPAVLEERLLFSRQVWGQVENELPTLNIDMAIDTRFVLALKEDEPLTSVGEPVNKSFIMSGLPPFPAIPEELAVGMGELPRLVFEFKPNTKELPSKTLIELAQGVLPILRSSTFYLKITGSAAWPPSGPNSQSLTEEQIKEFALSRAKTVAVYLITQGVDPNRLIIAYELPPLERRGITDEARLSQDRFVRLELVQPER